MSVILSHPTGNANVRAAVAGLAEAEILFRFYTSLASFPNSVLDKLGGINALAEIRRRSFDTRLQPFTKIYPWREVGRTIAAKLKLAQLISHEKGYFCVDNVYKSFDKYVALQLNQAAKKGVNAVYAYEDGAAYSFAAAKEIGLKNLYDLPIGYWKAARRLLKDEAELRPEWAATLTGFKDSLEKLSRKDEELKLADQIFVASSFTAKTLEDYPGRLAPIKVIPYGFPMAAVDRQYEPAVNKRNLKILFVGGLSQRKGIANLFEAIEEFKNHVELTVVGRKAVDNCAALNQALTKHKWISSLPHTEILNLMKTQDVLIFPSLFEGFGLVITEAMSQGTPVITTERTAGPDLIKHGENGWLIEAGSTDSLKDAIENLLSNPSLTAKIGKEALKTAQKRPWQSYGLELAKAIVEFTD